MPARRRAGVRLLGRSYAAISKSALSAITECSIAVKRHDPRRRAKLPRPEAWTGSPNLNLTLAALHAISGHGTMVDFTVRMAMASSTARRMPASSNG